MANYAVAAALASYTPLLVASETNEYGGLKYEGLLAAVAANPTMSASELGAALVDAFPARAKCAR
eukprot:187673-Prorocentrum_minimum.AAC.1